jgi:hypothetical protein
MVAESSAERFARACVARLCDRLGADGDPLTAPGPMRDRAQSIVEALRAGRDPVELADDFDELDDLLLRSGHASGLGVHRGASPNGPMPGYAPLPGVSGHPVLTVLGCPGERCPRVALPTEPDAATRACAVFGKPLREVRLRP